MRDDVRVSQTAGGSWLVDRRETNTSARVFKMKVHAIAFGRTLAFSSGGRLFIVGPDGIGVMQPSHSLTYPTFLK